MLDALHGLDFDVGSLVAGEVDVTHDQERLWAVSDVDGAVEAQLLDPALLASSLVEDVGERGGAVVEVTDREPTQPHGGDRMGPGELWAATVSL